MSADGKTIELRIPISHFGDESVPCPGSGSNEVSRNSQPFILPSAITSTKKDISSHEGALRENAKLPLSSGSNFLLHKSPHFIGKLRRVRVRLTGPLPLSGCEAPCENFIVTQTNLVDSQCQRFHRPSCRIAAIRVGVH